MSETEDIQQGPYVVGFDDAGATERTLVGGKGANLAQLVGAGLPVPAGFCVTTAAYEVLIDEPAIEDAINELAALDPTDTAAIADTGAALRARIQDCDVPEEIREAIERALDSTANDPEAAYAIRSSATAEDLSEASFAGQQETFLNVHREEITDRVRACMASLFTDRAIAYRARNEIPYEEVAIAVVVQRMITPDSSGILFTADPQTGNRHIASIDAGLGLGEALVSGEVTADNVRVDTRTGEVLDYESGDQQVAVRPLPEGGRVEPRSTGSRTTSGGTETVELSQEERASHVLSDEQIQTLVEFGKEIEALFECPQDIEWCLADGEFSIVQARPITSLFPLPSPGCSSLPEERCSSLSPSPADDRLHVYLSIGHAQAFPEAMPPLVRDIWRTYTHTLLGLNTDSRFVVEAGGRIYVDLTPFLRSNTVRQRLLDLLSTISEPAAAGLDDLLTRREEAFHDGRGWFETIAMGPTLVGTAWTGAKTGLPLIRKYIDGFGGAFSGEPTPEREEDLWDACGRQLAAQMRAPETPADRARAAFDLLTTETLVSAIPRMGPLVAAFAVGGWLQRRFPVAPEDVNAVGRGFPNELVTRINLGLGDLADVARDHPAVADALQDEQSLEEIEAVEGGAAFVAAFDDYLDEFGHRATGELDVSRPRWRDDPSGLLATVRANLEHGEAGEHHEHLQQLIADAEAAADRLCRQVNHGLFGPVRMCIVRRLIRTYRGYVQTREYPKQGFAHVFAAWHETLLAAGATLAAEGQLHTPEDIWFLRKDELFAALDGDSIDVDIGLRRADFERHAEMDAPPVLTSDGEAPQPDIEREDVPEDALVGTGVSSGVVEGVARVVHDPAEETIETDEILIAPSSDPGWTPLFLNAAGIVVEVGGRLSHGALVAREYGLPGVVSVPEATQRIETGQRVRVDGTQGTVEIIEEE